MGLLATRDKEVISLKEAVKKYEELDTGCRSPVLSPTVSSHMWEALKEMYSVLKAEYQRQKEAG